MADTTHEWKRTRPCKECGVAISQPVGAIDTKFLCNNCRILWKDKVWDIVRGMIE